MPAAGDQRSADECHRVGGHMTLNIVALLLVSAYYNKYLALLLLACFQSIYSILDPIHRTSAKGEQKLDKKPYSIIIPSYYRAKKRQVLFPLHYMNVWRWHKTANGSDWNKKTLIIPRSGRNRRICEIKRVKDLGICTDDIACIAPSVLHP